MNERKIFSKEETITELENLSKFQLPRWAFRGEKYYEYPLRTSLARFFDRASYNGPKKLKVEKNLLREFERRYHHYSFSEPRVDSEIEWLSLMRHYGAPTGLLDFTYSIYVAAYFAVEDISEKEDGFIYGINLDWCQDAASKVINAHGRNGKWVTKPLSRKEDEKTFKSLFFNSHQIDMVVAMNPFLLNQRITTQLSVFICPGNVNKEFSENLKALDGCEQPANTIKIKIPNKSRINILRSLFDMNINRASLFPGLDGFARSLGVFHPTVFNDFNP
jgi:hypothetical protein